MQRAVFLEERSKKQLRDTLCPYMIEGHFRLFPVLLLLLHLPAHKQESTKDYPASSAE